MAEIIESTYEIKKRLGSGGGGVVYLARHLRLEKDVVLKADKRKITTNPALLRREVNILKDLSHPHIPQVYDFFIENDTVYTAMAFVPGESLDRPLKRGERFSQPQVIQWARQLLEALDYLHSPIHGDPPRGYVHSDIKPANLMRTPEGDICLIDFNIAMAIGEEGVIGLSAGYASPEHYGLDYSTGGSDVTEQAEDIRIARRAAPNPRQSGGQTSVESAFPPATPAPRPSFDGEQDERTVLEAMRPDPSPGFTAPQGYRSSGAASEGATVLERDAGESANRRSDNPPSSSITGKRRKIIPDVRSDIYSVGATLYHLLSGVRPQKDAKEVIPLSDREFSPQLVQIISRAMNPNPDLRYQSAAEMLAAFNGLRANDPRVRRLKRWMLTVSIACTACLVAGVLTTFVGLKRMQTTEQRLKLAEYFRNELAKGDVDAAIQDALQALPQRGSLLSADVLPEAQRALTNALGVYDLSDGYKSYTALDLPSELIYIALAPDGSTISCFCSWNLFILDTDSCGMIASLPMVESAMAQVKYLDEHTIVYAGSDGLTAYDIVSGKTLWVGDMATSLAISEDGSTVAAVYRDEGHASVYRTLDGARLTTVDFDGRKQRVLSNDLLTDSGDNLLALSASGDFLCASFSDGSLSIFPTAEGTSYTNCLDTGSGYDHFEGDFSGRYLAFSATRTGDSVFVVIDTETMEQTGGFRDDTSFSVQTDVDGIYLKSGNILVSIDPVTGEQTPLVNSAETIQRFAVEDGQTLVAINGAFRFYDRTATLMNEYACEQTVNYLQLAGDVATVGSVDSSIVRLLRREDHTDVTLTEYDPSYRHDEARVSADGKTVMLFSYRGFCLYSTDGDLLCEIELPDAAEIRDQQYIREADQSRLEVTYNDGSFFVYSGETGELLRQELVPAMDDSLQETFLTDRYEIVAPLHGMPEVYDRGSGRLIYTLKEDAYLAYARQIGQYIVVQYIADGHCYGQLLDKDCQVLADLPYLCDVMDETLIFDYPSGQIRTSRILKIDELKNYAKNITGGN